MTRLISIATGREVLPGEDFGPWRILAIDWPGERLMVRPMYHPDYMLHPAQRACEAPAKGFGLMFLRSH